MKNPLKVKRVFLAGLLALAAMLVVPSAFATINPVPVTTGIGDNLGLSPFWDWKTIETEHFRITFPKELAETAQKATNYFEEANSVLVPMLKWQPIHKTQVLLIDNADAANGLTSAVLRFGIVLYITPPDNWFSTVYYDDWLRLLVFHEYTHMVNMDTAQGIWEVTRVLFGDVFLPNAIWPTWMLEGLAVYMETRFTHAGRGRSSYYEMILRSSASRDVLGDSDFITLDKVNGPNPYYPYGETAYTFGYQLMNQVARQDIGTKTADGDTPLEQGPPGHEGEHMLGEMSYRSGHRIPFFINGNLEDISGKEWYDNWALMIEDAKSRARGEISKIRSQPESHVEVVPTTTGDHETWDTTGMAFSPDGQWIAFTQDSSNFPNSLFLKNRQTGEVRRINEKIMGATLAFTPDSKNVIYSELNRKGLYYLWSDLKSYSIERDDVTGLTDSLRARDPDVSRDGKWVTFSMTRNVTTGLMIAPLTSDGKSVHLGKPKLLFWPAQYDAVHTPRFSTDGQKIYFSWHPNGKIGENIAVYDRGTGKTRVIAADGSFNRFPAVKHTTGDLYFLSDRSGVDNIYLYRDGNPVMVTNTVSGFAFPAFDEKGQLYADSFSFKGFQIAKVQELTPVNQKAVTIGSPPAPPATEESDNHAETAKHPVEDYSLWPSILPRQWLPTLMIYQNGIFAGGEIAGFDAVDRHRYVLGLAYDSLVRAPDILAVYSNRSLGVDLSGSVESYTSNINTDSNGNLLSYSRNVRYAADARLPIQYTFSTLTPIVSLYEERQFDKVPGANPSNSDIVSSDAWVPYIDTRLVFNEAHNSRLAISSEEGRNSEIGSRVYLNSGSTYLKTFVQDTEYWRTDFLMEHSVIIPALSWSWVNNTAINNGYANTDVVIEGRQSGRLINTLPSDSLDQLSIRGYPLTTFYAKQSVVGSLDYRFPLFYVFRGWGTNPFFSESFHGFVFGESAWFPGGRAVKALPSTGGGIQFDTYLFNGIPLTASTEYHKGFQENFGGTGELFFQLGVSSPISF